MLPLQPLQQCQPLPLQPPPKPYQSPPETLKSPLRSRFPTLSGYPYGGPPLMQPYGSGGYGAPPTGYSVPYGTGAPPTEGEKPSKPHRGGDYHPSAPPSFAPSSQYVGEKPSKTAYQTSAPPAAGPYGGYADPYNAGSEKSSKAQQGGGYGDPYSEKPSKPQQGTGTPTAVADPPTITRRKCSMVAGTKGLCHRRVDVPRCAAASGWGLPRGTTVGPYSGTPYGVSQFAGASAVSVSTRNGSERCGVIPGGGP